MEKIKKIYDKNRQVYRLLLILALWMIFMAIAKPKKFYKFSNFQTMAGQFPEYGLMALGCMLCMMTGGIDLSCVGVANLSSILVVNILIARFGADGSMTPMFNVIIFVFAIAFGALCGLFNGFLISVVGVPPILATLGVNELLTGISIVLTGGGAVSSFPKEYCEFFTGNIGGIVPIRTVVFVIVAVIIWLMLEKTGYGTKIKLLGTNQNVAKFSGLDNTGLLLRTYMTSGICAALGGMMMMATYASVRADYGSQYTMQAILIVVLGGVSPNGGTGKISGVITAIILLKFLESGINRFHNISSYYISLIWGGVLILALVMDYFSTGKNRKV